MTVHGVGRRSDHGHVAAFAPDGASFVAADLGSDTASVRDAATGERRVTLAGHAGEILTAAYSRDGELLATGGADGTARLWTPETGDNVRTLQAHEGGVIATRFSADGERLLTMGADRALRVWEVASGRQLHALEDAHQFTTSDQASPGAAAGESVAFVGDDRVAVIAWVVGSAPPSADVARVLDLSSGEEVAVLRTQGEMVNTLDLDVSADGALLAAGQRQGKVLLYRLPEGELLDVLEAHTGLVFDVEFSPDGTLLATGAVDGAKLLDVAGGKLRERLALRGHRAPVGSVSFSADATRLVTRAGSEARVWDVSPAPPGEVLRLPGPATGWHPHIAFTPDGRRLVATSGAEGEVRVFAVDSGEELLVLDHHARGQGPRGVIGIDVSPDGSRIATAGADGTMRISDAETGEELVAVRGLHCNREGGCVVNRAVFSPDGSRIATTGYDSTVRIFDVASGAELRVLRGHAELGWGTYPVAWSADGSRLLSRSAGEARIWDADRGQELLVLPAGGPGAAARWSPDGTQVLTEGAQGPTVFDGATGQLLRTVETGSATSELAFSLDGSRLAIGAFGDRSARIVDWPVGTERLKLPDGGFRFVFSPDGTLLAGVREAPLPFVRVFALEIDRLLEVARSRVTRSLTDEECRQYLQRACPSPD